MGLGRKTTEDAMTVKPRLISALVCLIGVLAAYQLSYPPGQFSFEPEREFHRVVTRDFVRDGPPGCPNYQCAS